MPESVRLDRWLCAVRFYKTRTNAQDACKGGLVKVNGNPAKSKTPVKVGDEVQAQAPRGLVIAEVKELEEKRQSAARARELYVDHSPPPPPKTERIAVRERGSGRPTKAERRAMIRFFGEP